MIGTALVTGAGTGIGRAIATALAQHGTRVCLTGRRLEALRETAWGIGGDLAIVHPGDLSSREDVDALAEVVRREFGQLDALVHCAGTYSRGRPSVTPVEELDALYRVHVRGPLLLTQVMLPLLQKRRGQIMFIGSSAVSRPRAETAHYAMAKAAQATLAAALRDDLGRDGGGIRVCTIHPGRTATPMQAAVHAAEGRAWDPDRLMQPEDVARMAIAALTLPRTAEVTDIHLRPTRP